MRRRALLAGLALAPPASSAAAPAPPDPVDTLRRALDAIPQGPALLASYPDAAANHRHPAFFPANDGVAYVYDNALAGLALVAAGDPLRAARLGDALVLAQTHDPDHHDGRLRNAYRAGPMQVHHASLLGGHGLPAARGTIDLPGWWDARHGHWAEDPYQVGSETGPIAWAILLWTALVEAGVNIDRYRHAAGRAADWIAGHCRAPRGFTGGVFGWGSHPRRLGWTSTEQNTDLAVAFHRLGRDTDAAHARHFVAAMRDARSGLFRAGLTPDGGLNPMIAADATLWPNLAGLAPKSVIAPSLAALGHPGHAPAGIGFSSASRGNWTEGTAFALLALRRAGTDPAAARRFAATLRAAIAPSGWLRATQGETLATGLTIGPDRHAKTFVYYPVPALAPTAWAVLAARKYNPLGA